MTRSNTTKQTINVPKKHLNRLLDIADYQGRKLKHYISTYGDVEMFYGEWRKKDEKKNNI